MTLSILCFRNQGQTKQRSLHQVCDPVPADPVAPVRSPLLLLRGDGEGAAEVARRAAGLRQTQQQR